MKSKKIVNIFIHIFLIVFSAGVIFSIYNIIDWYLSGVKNKKVLDEINTIIDEEIEEEIKEENASTEDTNFERLKKINNEVVAFVKVNGTNIEYTVVKHKDNSYYLTHSFDNSYNKYGWIYANYENKFDGSDKNITLFGHNMKNGSMFGSLKKVLKSDWQNNEENLKILFITEKEKSMYQVFSTYKIYKESYFATSSFSSEKDFKDFIKTIKSRSNKNYHVDVSSKDQILTLSTCYSDNNYRVVLHAKKIIEN